MKIFLKVTGISLLLIGIGLIIFILGSQSSDEILYQTTAEVQPKIWVTAELRRNHPFLAEYKKGVTFFSKNKPSFHVDLGIDTGGYSDIEVYLDKDRLVVVDINSTWYSMNINNGHFNKEKKEYWDKNPRNYLGKFTLTPYSGSKNWQFIKASNGEYQAPHRLKGG